MERLILDGEEIQLEDLAVLDGIMIEIVGSDYRIARLTGEKSALCESEESRGT